MSITTLLPRRRFETLATTLTTTMPVMPIASVAAASCIHHFAAAPFES